MTAPTATAAGTPAGAAARAPEDAGAVTVLTVEPDHDALVEVIEAWTRIGLLRPAILLGKAAWSGPLTDVAELPVRRFDSDDDADIPLRAVLRNRALRVVRFVAVRPLLEAAPDPGASERLNAVADALRGVLAARTRLLRVNLLVPSGTRDEYPGLLEPRWEVNVVVSPEDRPNDDALDHGVRRPAAFAPHAALATATVAGLWRHLPAGPFDVADQAVPGNHGRIVVARTAARVVDGRNLPDRVVDKMVRNGVPALLADLLDRGAAAVSNDAVLVDEMAHALRTNLSDQPFDFRPDPDRVEPPPPLLVFTLATLVRTLTQRARRRVEAARTSTVGLTDLAVNWLAGSFGSSRTGSDPLPPTPREVRAVAHAAPGLLPRRVPPPNLVWGALRQLCFSLTDGGEFPAEVREAIGTLRPAVSRAGWIVPPPTDSFQLTGEERKLLRTLGRPCGTVRATDMNAAAHVKARLAEAGARLAELAAAAPDSNPRLSDVDDMDGSVGAGDGPGGPVGAGRGPGGPGGSTGSDWADGWGEAKRLLDDCRGRFATWDSRQRAHSLIGRLTAHVSKQLWHARKDLTRRRAEYEKLEKQRAAVLDELERAYESGRQRRWLAPTFAGSAALFGASVTLPLPLVGLPGSLLSAVLLVMSVLSGGWLTGRLFRRVLREIALERELDIVERRRRAVVAAVERWPTEADRLASVYDILTDWGEIIGWMLHEPFGAGGREAALSSLDRSRLPQALQFGTGPADGELDRLVNATARDVCGRGWVTNLYTTVEREVMDDMGTSTPGGEAPDPDYSPAADHVDATLSSHAAAPDSAAPDSARAADDAATGAQTDPGAAPAAGAGQPVAAYTDPDPDDGETTWNPRHRLLYHFRIRDCAARARRLMTSRIGVALRRFPPDQLMRTIHVAVDDVDGPDDEADAPPVPVLDFLNGIAPRPRGSTPCPPMSSKTFTMDGQWRDKAYVRRILLWCPESVEVAGTDESDVTVHADNSIAVADGATYQYRIQITRLDLSDDCEPSDIRILAATSED
jgi:hypothetical protein